jgi:hypothetical protein
MNENMITDTQTGVIPKKVKELIELSAATVAAKVTEAIRRTDAEAMRQIDSEESTAADVVEALSEVIREIGAAMYMEMAAYNIVGLKRQAEGVERAKAQGKYTGRQRDETLHQHILTCLDQGHSIRKVAEIVGCSKTTVQKAKILQAQRASTELIPLHKCY